MHIEGKRKSCKHWSFNKHCKGQHSNTQMAGHFTFCLTLITILRIICSRASSNPQERTSAFFIFGDSNIDTGNNNYINTIPKNKADYEPYGQNGFFRGPTGRFSDGRVLVDFIAEYANLPLIPPYLQPSAEYTKGANFASGGAGVLPETHKGLVIDLKRQLVYFDEVQKSLIEKLGEEEAKKLISEAVYFIGVGSNDYICKYIGNPEPQQNYNRQHYVEMVVGNLTLAIRELYEKGGRKFVFLSLAPLGCIPAIRIINPKASKDGCFEEVSAMARAHNDALKLTLTNLQHSLQGFKYCNSDLYDWLYDRMNNPSKFGFKDGMNACCGLGLYGGIYSCGSMKPMHNYSLCENVNDHVWWDSYHPTERIHEQFAKALWTGSPPSVGVGPYNVEELFSHDKLMSSAMAHDVVDHDPEAQVFLY